MAMGRRRFLGLSAAGCAAILGIFPDYSAAQGKKQKDEDDVYLKKAYESLKGSSSPYTVYFLRDGETLACATVYHGNFKMIKIEVAKPRSTDVVERFLSNPEAYAADFEVDRYYQKIGSQPFGTADDRIYNARLTHPHVSPPFSDKSGAPLFVDEQRRITYADEFSALLEKLSAALEQKKRK